MTQHFIDLSVCDSRGGSWPFLMKGTKGSAASGAGFDIGPSKVSGKNGFLFASNDSATTTTRSVGAGISAADVDVLLKVSGSPRFGAAAFSNTGPIAVAARASSIGSTGRPANCYYVATNGSTSNTHNRNLALWKVVSGTQTQVGSTVSSVITAADPYDFHKWIYLRFQCVGTTIRAKLWRDGDTEPGSWSISATDSSITAAGDVAQIFHSYGNAFVSSWMGIGTGVDSAPNSFPGGDRVVAGTLKTPTGTAAEGYLVRCYHRDSGMMLGETLSSSTGAFAFSLPISATEKVYCIGVDQLGNSWKAPIVDLVTPVAP